MSFNANSSMFKIGVAVVVIALASACSSSGSPNSDVADAPDSATVDENTDGGTQTTNPPSGNDNSVATSGEFDLSKYLFHDNVLTTGGQINFDEKIFNKDNAGGDSVITLSRSFVNNNGTIEEYSSDEKIKTFTISSTAINENLLDSANSRTSSRYANIGDTYIDAVSTPPTNSPIAVEQNATCVLQEHLATFDLASATADIALASGVYDDVIRVQCVTSFISGTTKSPHTTLNSYFAKGVGVIFNEGNVFLLEDVYIVEEY